MIYTILTIYRPYIIANNTGITAPAGTGMDTTMRNTMDMGTAAPVGMNTIAMGTAGSTGKAQTLILLLG